MKEHFETSKMFTTLLVIMFHNDQCWIKILKIVRARKIALIFMDFKRNHQLNVLLF